MLITITAIGSLKGVRYNVDTQDGRLHILNEKSLKWNLKRVFKLSNEEVGQVMKALHFDSQVSFELKQVGAA